MIEQARISGALQENILTALCFDDQNAKLIRAGVSPQLFESAVFREVAGAAIDFIDQYGEPIKDHLPDHLEHILKGDDHRRASTYQRLLDNLYQAKDGVNGQYVLTELHKFVRAQTFKAGLVEAFEATQAGNIDAAESAMSKALKAQVVAFEPGLNLADPNMMIGLLDNLEEPGFDLGIKPLDDMGIIPRRKEMMVFVAPRGRGKSWFCVHAAKYAMLQRWSTVVISLEMSDKRYAARYIQSFFSISKRDTDTQVARLIRDRDGKLEDILQEQVKRMSLADPDIHAFLSKRIKAEFQKRSPLFIKQFPTGSCTLDMIRAYLDSLERFEGVTPDLIIIDYPALMKHNANNKRIELGMLVEGIRGIGVERNAATIVPWQGNRVTETAKFVRGADIAEDISILATADTLLTMSQTPMEKKLGLARIGAEKARNDADKFVALITQAYNIGQFCLDSMLLDGDYFELIEGGGPGDRRDHEAEDD